MAEVSARTHDSRASPLGRGDLDTHEMMWEKAWETALIIGSVSLIVSSGMIVVGLAIYSITLILNWWEKRK